MRMRFITRLNQGLGPSLYQCPKCKSVDTGEFPPLCYSPECSDEGIPTNRRMTL